ncbi:hypothetical protein C9374_007402 [Naegleria lovaniensis]|uniref:Uncharacterized protein n=1 Tax=Naegleria lovaniensis TaxID=51637 RepID=A0AA88GIK5_NAELO|nr:uncharacterized protein C9374_007402 [Naegleria lovaniensis]KAG2379263.1 hypothetical protein C9374_007402 [Naegleria lovaniensis]
MSNSVFMIDVHTHMYDEKFLLPTISFDDSNNRDKDYSELDRVIENATNQNIQRIIVVSEEENTAHQVLELCKRYPNVIRGGIGLHPCCVSSEEQIYRIRDLILKHLDELCCIGEVGLDFTPGVLNGILERNPHLQSIEQVKQLQRKALEVFIELSKETGLALNVHSRSAGRPTIQLLHEKGASKVLMHCFDGSAKVIKEGLTFGYYFSVPANVIRSKQIQQLVEIVPIDRILLETDSPALVPNLPEQKDFATKEEFDQAIKKARNDPSNIPLSAQMIAQIKKLTLPEVIFQTFESTKRLFPRAVK